MQCSLCNLYLRSVFLKVSRLWLLSSFFVAVLIFHVYSFFSVLSLLACFLLLSSSVYEVGWVR